MDLFFAKQGPVWETLRTLESRLQQAGLDYVVIGGLALNAHGYARQTEDIDIVLTPSGWTEFEQRLRGSIYPVAPGAIRRSQDPQHGVNIDVLVAGEIAGNRHKNRTIRFPDPAWAEEHAGLRTVSLARLIELKLVTWRFKDWGDVAELIRRNHLSEQFAEQLDPAVRLAFGECFDQATDPGYGHE